MDVPGGAIETYDGEILIRSKGQAYTGDEFGIIPVLSLPDGSPILVVPPPKSTIGWCPYFCNNLKHII